MRKKGTFKKKDGSDLREWLEDSNNFILLEHPVLALKYCDVCAERNERLESAARVKKSQKLRVMDLFAGERQTFVISFRINYIF